MRLVQQNVAVSHQKSSGYRGNPAITGFRRIARFCKNACTLFGAASSGFDRSSPSPGVSERSGTAPARRAWRNEAGTSGLGLPLHRRYRLDPVAALLWLVITPGLAVAFWYWAYRLLVFALRLV